ncbi:SDR family NAD(P)-dependent oxidoreductase [Streptomyces clavuligerus]|uniref:Oxidoreductase n=1 Tax=Streptomyces clavuligerus TaxID=1901 RepID=B5GPW6_STRCL|nr:SDR family NAD(P)-dependent oxidoreductase [Streptomyces clavuligerus]ANW19781.1 oxidoreductase [Streptomyces clavuligerus]AXU14396.1 SDR family oxidoreductase [Streptomyces clavuligerus]EDY48362.1 oxidoreductase [Streptomyces clavuligerus]EFG07368.1 oxidoreductase [Streptomyces clavuligerus]MBY6304403.1 SDR family oxidoreductase [Streptomyces clavuligerus]
MSESLKRFDGHAALITGGARGVGEATARRLASEGARVLIADIDTETAERTAATIPGADFVLCDVSDPERVDAAVAYAVERFGRLDVLVNNAFANTEDAERLEDQPDGSWTHVLDICLTGAFRCARAALPHLEASGRGAIVNIGSVNAEVDFGGHAYSAAKAGLASFTRTLAGDAGPRGVRVNQINPGTIRTRAWEGEDEGLAELGRRLYPLGRVGEPEDIAAAVAFLASSDAAWITGTTLRVDGGILAVNQSFQPILEAAKKA